MSRRIEAVFEKALFEIGALVWAGVEKKTRFVIDVSAFLRNEHQTSGHLNVKYIEAENQISEALVHAQG